MDYYTDYDLRIIPVFGDSDDAQVDRFQSVDQTAALNRIQVKELGNPDVVGYIKQAPAITYRGVQNEFGKIDFWRKICNKGDSVNTLSLSDFGTPAFDLVAYTTNDDGSFAGSLWIPKLRVSGFSINLGGPQELIARNFDFVGEDWIYLRGSNKYLIHKKYTLQSGDIDGNDVGTITIEDPVAAEDPDNTGSYVMRVVRIRDGVATELIAGTDYTSTSTALSVNGSQAGDVIKYWYSASSYITGQSPFTPNTSDLAGILGDSVTITLESGNTLYRLQTCTLDVRFDRQDLFELGNSEVVQRSIRSKTVTITLGRLFEDATIESILRGQGASYGKLDVRKFIDDVTLRVYIYANNEKKASDFKIGYKATKLAPSELGGGVSIDNYEERRNTLIGESLIISNDKSEIDS